MDLIRCVWNNHERYKDEYLPSHYNRYIGPLCVAGDVITQPNSFMLVVMVQIHPAVF